MKTDTQIANRNTETIDVLVGDKVYGGQMLRSLAWTNSVWPLIKPHEFTPLREAWNARVNYPTLLCSL